MLERISAIVHELVKRPLSAQRFFLVVAAPIVFSLVFIIPPFQAPDEHTHFYKEVYQSRGHLVAHPLPAPHRVGDYLPAMYSQTVNHYKYMFLDHTQKANKSQIKQDLLHPTNDSSPILTDFENTAQYPPLAYLPQTVAILLVRLLHGSVLLQLYAARLATAACWLVLVFFAIRWIPFAKWGAVALTLTPLSLFLATSSSNDAITFGISLLFIAVVLRATTKATHIKRNELWLLYGLGLSLGLCKPPYLILVALALAIPRSRFSSQKGYILSLLKLFGVTLLAAVTWELLVHPILLNFYPGSDSAGQIRYMLHHPVTVSAMILKTLVIYPIGDDMLLQLVGLKAWMDAQTPFWLIGTDYILIVLAALYSPLKARAVYITAWIPRLLSLALMIVGVLLISLLLYVTYTPVGLNTIVGLQGRYFIPFSYLFLAIVGGHRSISIRLQGRSQTYLKFALALVAITVWPLVISRYYLG